MSIRTKVISGFVGVLLLFVAATTVNYFRSASANSRLALISDLYLPLSRLLVQVHGNIQVQSEDMRRVFFEEGKNSASQTYSRVARNLYPYVVSKKFQSAQELLDSYTSAQDVHLKQIRLDLGKSRELFQTLVAAQDKETFETQGTKLRTHLLALIHRVDRACENITHLSQREAREILVTSLIVSALVVLFGVFMVFLSYRALEPLPSLLEGIDKISEGDFDQSLKVQAGNKDEITLLARRFNQMIVALRERDGKIRQQQKELVQSERLAAVGKLSAEIVHEIRNPLNSIYLNIEWIENEMRHGDPEIKRTLRSVIREVDRLNQIAESYLVRARVETNSGGKTEVNGILRELVEFFREEDRAKRINVETEIASEPIYVKSDRSKLKQAFINIMKNAREAMPHGGRISIRSETRDNVSRVWFQDTGHGMTEGTRKQSFEPFFTTKANGTGLGLVLTRSIVEEARGTVQCESKLGQGTVFTFQFPV